MRTEATVKLTCRTCSYSIGICVDLSTCGADPASAVSRELERQVVQEAKARGWHEITLISHAAVRLTGKLCPDCANRVLRVLGVAADEQQPAGTTQQEQTEATETEEISPCSP